MLPKKKPNDADTTYNGFSRFLLENHITNQPWETIYSADKIYPHTSVRIVKFGLASRLSSMRRVFKNCSILLTDSNFLHLFPVSSLDALESGNISPYFRYRMFMAVI